MRILDTPVRPLLGRTPRELMLIGGGIAVCTAEVMRAGTNPWHLFVFATGTAMFAVRFFAARVVAIGILLSALAAHLVNLRFGDGWIPVEMHWSVYPLAAAVLLLLSRDLAERFDFAQSGPGLRLNRWRELPRSHWRAATALGWALGILGHFLLRAWYPAGDAAPLWPLIAIVGCVGCVFLLFTGRSIVFVLAAILGVSVAILVLPDVAAAERYLAHPAYVNRPASMWIFAPGSALPAALASVATAAIALPYALRHLYRSLLASQ